MTIFTSYFRSKKILSSRSRFDRLEVDVAFDEGDYDDLPPVLEDPNTDVLGPVEPEETASNSGSSTPRSDGSLSDEEAPLSPVSINLSSIKRPDGWEDTLKRDVGALIKAYQAPRDIGPRVHSEQDHRDEFATGGGYVETQFTLVSFQPSSKSRKVDGVVTRFNNGTIPGTKSSKSAKAVKGLNPKSTAGKTKVAQTLKVPRYEDASVKPTVLEVLNLNPWFLAPAIGRREDTLRLLAFSVISELVHAGEVTYPVAGLGDKGSNCLHQEQGILAGLIGRGQIWIAT